MLPDKKDTRLQLEKYKEVSLLVPFQGYDLKKVCENFKDIPQISYWKKHHSEITIKRITVMLLELAANVQVSKRYTPQQATTLASAIAADFWYLRFEDLHLAFRSILTGHFKLFDRLDMAVLYECLRGYDAEREAMMERLRESQHAQNKASSGSEYRGSLTIDQYWRNLGHKKI